MTSCTLYHWFESLSCELWPCQPPGSWQDLCWVWSVPWVCLCCFHHGSFPLLLALTATFTEDGCPWRGTGKTNSPTLTTSTDTLVAHRRKASPVRDCSWHSSEGRETYFWHLFIPFEFLSIHIFSVELAPLCHWISSACTTFACNQALKAQLSWTYSMKVSPLSTILISINWSFLCPPQNIAGACIIINSNPF